MVDGVLEELLDLVDSVDAASEEVVERRPLLRIIREEAAAMAVTLSPSDVAELAVATAAGTPRPLPPVIT